MNNTVSMVAVDDPKLGKIYLAAFSTSEKAWKYISECKELGEDVSNYEIENWIVDYHASRF